MRANKDQKPDDDLLFVHELWDREMTKHSNRMRLGSVRTGLADHLTMRHVSERKSVP